MPSQSRKGLVAPRSECGYKRCGATVLEDVGLHERNA